jgi:hypothetical protein
MSAITDSIDEGRETRKISRYFNKENNIANQQEEVPMTTSKQFKQSYIRNIESFKVCQHCCRSPCSHRWRINGAPTCGFKVEY